MRPEIASLLTPHIYSELENHPSVFEYDNIKVRSVLNWLLSLFLLVRKPEPNLLVYIFESDISQSIFYKFPFYLIGPQ